MSRQILLALPGLLLAGCASFYTQQGNLTEQIDVWLEQHQYERALSTILALSADHPQYPELVQSIPAIKQQRQVFLTRVLADARQYEATQDWVSAENIIQQGLSRMPDAPELIEQASYYRSKRESRLEMNEAAILVAKARYIIDARPYQESLLYNAANNLAAQQQFDRFIAEAQQTSRELYALGQSYWRDKKLTQAKEAINLSIQTAPNELSHKLLTEILVEEQAQRELAENRQQRSASEQLPQLTADFYQQLNANDFDGARLLQREIAGVDPDQAKRLSDILESMLSARIAILTSAGDNLYNSGYVQQAAERWRKVMQLDPDNTAVAQKLERAETFLANLERWQADNPESE